MSAYAQAFLGVADMLTGASADAAYEAAYGTYYSSYATMHNAANQKVAAEANIAAITQDKIKTDTVIAMKQDEAEAQAKVMAAVSGTEGQSVDDTIYQTKVSSSIAKQNNAANAEQEIEKQLAQVYQAQSTLLAADNPQVAEVNTMMNLVSDIAPVLGDTSYMGELGDGMDSLMAGSSDDMDGFVGDGVSTSGGVFLPVA